MRPLKKNAPIALLALLSWTAAQPADTAFLNVDVLPMTSDSVLEAQTVIVSDGKIARIGPVGETPVPEGAEVIDGTDATWCRDWPRCTRTCRRRRGPSSTGCSRCTWPTASPRCAACWALRSTWSCGRRCPRARCSGRGS